MAEKLLIAFVTIGCISLLCAATGVVCYEIGQTDALCGHWHWMATEQPDGTLVFSHLSTPTTQPVIARGK